MCRARDRFYKFKVKGAFLDIFSFPDFQGYGDSTESRLMNCEACVA